MAAGRNYTVDFIQNINCLMFYKIILNVFNYL